VNGPLRDVVNCHCSQCRRTHGHFAAYGAAALGDFKLTNSDSLKWYQSSQQARRGFCSVCGASLFWVSQGDDYIAIAAGTGFRTVAHIYVADAGDYHTIADGVRTYSGTLRERGSSER
jgi:hypothetical protein